MFSDLRAIDVFAAAQRIDGVTRRTALRRSSALSDQLGDVYLKLENEQVTGSFKIRGAYNAIACLPEDARARGVVASSAGNHGLGVAYAARKLGVPASIYVPSTAPDVKRNGIVSMGATVDATATHYDAALALGTQAAAEQELSFINACLGDDLIAGQGTIALEVAQELPELRTIVVPVGGAGLLAGIGSFLRSVAPGVRIVGVQSVNTAAMARSLEAGAPVSVPSAPTLADGLAGDIDEFALDVGRRALDEMLLLTEDELERAIAWLARHEGMIAEGAAAVGVAALLSGKLDAFPRPMVLVITGRNIEPRVHERILIERSLQEPRARTAPR